MCSHWGHFTKEFFSACFLTAYAADKNMDRKTRKLLRKAFKLGKLPSREELYSPRVTCNEDSIVH